MTTLLVAEHDNKTVKDSTGKALTAAKALGADVHVLIAGKDCKAAADAAAKFDGVKKVLVADAEAYEHQLAEPLATLIVSLAGTYDAIVSPATTTGKNVMPRVAALLDRHACLRVIGVRSGQEALRAVLQRPRDPARPGEDRGASDTEPSRSVPRASEAEARQPGGHARLELVAGCGAAGGQARHQRSIRSQIRAAARIGAVLKIVRS